ncbi:MAG: hypothetical protein R2713_03305 [Ilumatobacteraceae bacterium]
MVVIDHETLERRARHADSRVDCGCDLDVPIETLLRLGERARFVPVIVGSDGRVIAEGSVWRAGRAVRRAAPPRSRWIAAGRGVTPIGRNATPSERCTGTRDPGLPVQQMRDPPTAAVGGRRHHRPRQPPAGVRTPRPPPCRRLGAPSGTDRSLTVRREG